LTPINKQEYHLAPFIYRLRGIGSHSNKGTAMSTVEITLTDLTFPANLEDKYCKFRPLISLRYRDFLGNRQYAREALPGLGPRDYWECEKKNKKKDDYVRHATLPKVDMDKVDVTKREISFTLDVMSFERIEIELFDIDIKTGFEQIVQIGLQSLPPDVLSQLNPGLPPNLTLIKGAVEQATGTKVDDLEKGLLDKLIGKADGTARSIFVRSQDLTTPPQETVTLAGPGKQGDYSISLKLDVAWLA
jgi:hypothetical protein